MDLSITQHFSRRQDVVDAAKNDPLRKAEGTFRGLGDMVDQVCGATQTDA